MSEGRLVMSLIKSYQMLQNIRVTAFTVSELLRKNQQWWGKTTPPPRLKFKDYTLLGKLG